MKSPYAHINWPNGRFLRPAAQPSFKAKMKRLGVVTGIDMLLLGYVDKVRGPDLF